MSFIFILCALFVLWEGFFKEVRTLKMAPNKLQSYLVTELNKKYVNKELPTEWDQISVIKYRFPSAKAKKILAQSAFVKTNPKGNIKLTVTFMDEPDSNDFVLAQFELVDLASNNLKFEFFLRFNINKPLPN